MQASLQAIADDEIENVMFSVPPQHGKTEQNTISFAVWMLARQLGIRVAIVSYNQQQANKVSLAARRLAEGVGMGIMGDKAAVEEWHVEGGGKIRAAGIGAGLTGYAVDLGIIDDPIKDREEADSQKRRDSIWDYYTDVFLTRNPMHQVLTGTEWHEDGLHSRILNSAQSKKWTVVKVPAIAGEMDVLGRSPGEALWPERVSIEELESRRAMNPFSFEAMYQQNPTPREGSLFKVSAVRYCDASEVPPGLSVIRRWDMAASSSGDYTAGVKVAGPDPSGFYYVMDSRRGKWEVHDRNRTILDVAAMDGPVVKIVGPQDPGAAGVEAAGAFVRMLSGYNVSTERETGSKELRAEPFAAQLNAGNVVLVRGGWNNEFLEELRTFPNGKHDDQVDGASGAFNELARPSIRLIG